MLILRRFSAGETGSAADAGVCWWSWFFWSRATCDVGFAGLANEAASARDDGSAGDVC